MGFFVNDALAAATAGAAPQGDGTFSLVMVVVIFVLFYFMLIRPQNKRAKQHRDIVSQLKKGDEVVTSGGILGKVTKLDEQYVKISLASEVEVNIQRGSITAVLPKGTLESL